MKTTVQRVRKFRKKLSDDGGVTITVDLPGTAASDLKQLKRSMGTKAAIVYALAKATDRI